MKKNILIYLPLICLSVSIAGCSNSSGGYKFEDVSNKDGSMSYEIFVRSFYDSDGDGIGDINGVSEKLPYLYDLGIKTVWLMPIHQSPSYHGYDVSDYYSVHKDYGTLEDFDNLVNKAKEYNIDIMLDMVFNHSSLNNPYFRQSYNDYYNANYGEGSKADWYNWSTTSSSGYSYYGGLYYEARFDSSMPDFNLDSESLRQEIDNIMKFWIKDHGVKGFRLDAVLYYYYYTTAKNVEFMTWLEDTAHKYDEDFYMVGECWATGDEMINNYHKSSLDSFFRFPNAYGGDYSMINLAKASGNITNIIKTMENNEKAIKNNNPNGYSSYFLSNHDQDRISAAFNETQNKCAASLLCLLPGTPFMYYGEEIQLVGVRENGDNSDVRRRLPMIWSEKDKTGQCDFPEKNKTSLDTTEQVKKGVNDRLKDGYSLLNHYKKVINIRNKYPFLKHGTFTSMMNQVDDYTPWVIIYKISLGNDYIIVVHNFAGEKVEINSPGEEILDEINTSKKAPKLSNGTLILQPYSSVVMH